MEKSHLVIFEKSMNSRFIEFAEENKMSYSTLNMDNLLIGGLFLGLINRIINRNHFKKRLNKLIEMINDKQPKQIFLSNIEGYIGLSGSKILKEKFPEIKFIALQHGVFPLKNKTLKDDLIRFLNKITFFCFGICVLGEGFGGILVDKYIVYGKAEKTFLVNQKKWEANNIEVNLKFLKSHLLKSKLLNNTTLENNTIFLLQSLSGSNICSAEDEKILIDQTLKYLSKKYSKVYIKEHPFCKDRIQGFKLPKNAEIIDDMINGFNNCKCAYSFFSTALIDAKFFDLDTYAIFSNKLRVDKSLYKIFDNLINFEDEIIA